MGRHSRTRPLGIAVDTGGTFTDCVWVDRGRVQILKVFSTPRDPSQAILDAVKQIAAAGPLWLLHGTTVGTNTLLQRTGARVALVTTAGFEDAIEIGRQARPKLYDFFFDRVEPLVPRELRFGVEERTGSDGEILRAPSPPELRSLLARLREAKPEAVAISLLFPFANPQNETAIAQTLHALNVPVSVSHQILPELREYERTSTVVVNAYLQPVMQRYLENLGERMRANREDEIRGKPWARIFVMQSSGGITALGAAAREPVRTVLSGPAGGVVGAAATAGRSGYERIITFDMGGTSTDVSLVDHEIRTGAQAEIAGLPIGVPMLDIHTVGAGGGSIARFDAGGALRVGPESAGADPGPICYGRGTQPTVTDANLLLGRLRPARFLGGSFTLDLERTQNVTSEWLKKSGCKFSLQEFASGVVRVVNANMEKALRVVSIERGYDPREFALVAFGGAGGLHACELAQALSIPQVIVPPLPGALSAFGILVSNVVKNYSRTVLWRAADQLPIARFDEEFARLRKKAEHDLRGEGWNGKIQYHFSVDVRYRGQGFELNLPFSRKLVADFCREHERRYRYSYPAREVELVTLRLRATMKSSLGKIRGTATAGPRLSGQSRPRALNTETGRIFASGKGIVAKIFDRDSLKTGEKWRGPAIVTEYSATTFVPPTWHFGVDKSGSLILES